METSCNHPHWNSSALVSSVQVISKVPGIGWASLYLGNNLGRPKPLQDSKGKHSSQCLVNHSAKAYPASNFLRCLLQHCGTFDERRMCSNILTPSPPSSAPFHSPYRQNEFLMVWDMFVSLLFGVVFFFGVLSWVQCVHLKWQPPFYITGCNCHRPLKTSQLTIIFSHFISHWGSTSANDLDVTGFAISH